MIGCQLKGSPMTDDQIGDPFTQGAASVGALTPISVEPDTASEETDGVYVTYEYLGQLVRRANGRTHCPGCDGTH